MSDIKAFGARPMISKVWNWIHSSLGRGITGLTALVTLTWFLWPDSDWRLDGGALAALIVAISAWILSLTPSEARKPSNHDLELLNKFRGLFTDNARYFLREYDLGASFQINDLAPINNLSDRWHGAEYEFDDDDVQNRLRPLIEAAQGLSRRLAQHIDVFDISGQWASLAPTAERIADWYSDETRDRINDYNHSATKLIDDVDEFIKFARKRLST